MNVDIWNVWKWQTHIQMKIDNCDWYKFFLSAKYEIKKLIRKCSNNDIFSTKTLAPKKKTKERNLWPDSRKKFFFLFSIFVFCFCFGPLTWIDFKIDHWSLIKQKKIHYKVVVPNLITKRTTTNTHTQRKKTLMALIVVNFRFFLFFFSSLLFFMDQPAWLLFQPSNSGKKSSFFFIFFHFWCGFV